VSEEGRRSSIAIGSGTRGLNGYNIGHSLLTNSRLEASLLEDAPVREVTAMPDSSDIDSALRTSLQRVQPGRTSKVLRSVYEHVSRLLRSFPVQSFDREDVKQEVKLKFYRQWMSHRAIQNPRAWLRRVCSHAIVDQLRKQRRQIPTGSVPLDHPDVAELAAKVENPGDRLDQQERKKRLLEAISELTPYQQELIRRHGIQQESFEQIAKDLRKGIEAVRRCFYDAIDRLQKLMNPVKEE